MLRLIFHNGDNRHVCQTALNQDAKLLLSEYAAFFLLSESDLTLLHITITRPRLSVCIIGQETHRLWCFIVHVFRQRVSLPMLRQKQTNSCVWRTLFRVTSLGGSAGVWTSPNLIKSRTEQIWSISLITAPRTLLQHAEKSRTWQACCADYGCWAMILCGDLVNNQWKTYLQCN